jgi:hypothetical protein
MPSHPAPEGNGLRYFTTYLTQPQSAASTLVAPVVCIAGLRTIGQLRNRQSSGLVLTAPEQDGTNSTNTYAVSSVRAAPLYLSPAEADVAFAAPCLAHVRSSACRILLNKIAEGAFRPIRIG